MNHDRNCKYHIDNLIEDTSGFLVQPPCTCTPIESPEEKCQCQEMTCPTGCKNNHTHKTFFCDKCEPEAVKKMYGKDENCLEGVECKATCEEEKGGWEEEFDRQFMNCEFWNSNVPKSIKSFLRTALQSQRTEMLKAVEEKDDILDDMWGLICNVNAGDIEGEKQEWKDAFFRIREKYFTHLSAVRESLLANQ